MKKYKVGKVRVQPEGSGYSKEELIAMAAQKMADFLNDGHGHREYLETINIVTRYAFQFVDVEKTHCIITFLYRQDA